MSKDRAKRKAKIILGGIIVMLMITSVIGFMSSFRGTKYRYRGFKFIIENDRYWIKVNDQKVGFHFSPEDVERIPAEGIENLKSTRMIYISFNATSDQYLDLARFDLQKKCSLIGIYSVQGSGFKDTGFPYVDCENATEYVPVVFFTLGNETKIFKKGGNCIIAQAENSRDFLRLENRIVYELFGIIE